MNEFVQKVYGIKAEVRDMVLKKFVQRCLQKHCVAFF